MDTTTTLPPEPGSARAARRFVATALHERERDHVADAVELLTSELVTNAILHARTDITVSVTFRGDAVRVEVSDRNPRVPVHRRYDVEAPTGRGLELVDVMAGAWGVEAGDPDKTVWFEVPS